jgi:hypothetical protein
MPGRLDGDTGREGRGAGAAAVVGVVSCEGSVGSVTGSGTGRAGVDADPGSGVGSVTPSAVALPFSASITTPAINSAAPT